MQCSPEPQNHKEGAAKVQARQNSAMGSVGHSPRGSRRALTRLATVVVLSWIVFLLRREFAAIWARPSTTLTAFHAVFSTNRSAWIRADAAERAEILDALEGEDEPVTDMANHRTVFDEIEEALAGGKDKVVPRSVSSLPRTSSKSYDAILPNTRYLMYTPSGGFGNQLICLINAIRLAKAGRRTLLVPPYGRHSNLFRGYLDLKDHEIVPMDMVLDFEFMEQFTGVKLHPIGRRLEDFKKQVVGNRTRVKIMPLIRTSLHHPDDMSIFGKVYRMTKSRNQIVYFRGKFFTIRWLDKKIFSNVRYSPFLQKMAFIIAEEFFNHRFNAIHVRVGDYARSALRKDSWRFVKAALIMDWDPETPLYVATEAEKRHPYWKPLKERFQNATFVSDLTSRPRSSEILEKYVKGTPMGSVRMDLFGLVEQLLCIRAQKWIGTQVSTFSLLIAKARTSKQAVPDFVEHNKKLVEEGYTELRLNARLDWRGPAKVSVDKNIGGPKGRFVPNENIVKMDEFYALREEEEKQRKFFNDDNDDYKD